MEQPDLSPLALGGANALALKEGFRNLAAVMKLSLGVAAITVAFAGNAHAGLIGPGIVVGNAIVSLASGGQSSSTFGALNNPGGSASASASLSVSASGNTFVGTLGRLFGGSGVADLEYFYAVNGPSNVQVPLIITGNLGSSVTGGPFSIAQSSITGAFGTIQVCSDLQQSLCHGLPSAAVLNKGFTVTSDTQQDVDLSADAFGGEGAATSVSTGEAQADPIITIDPTFLADNPGFSLVFSADIQQPSPTSSVPEPASIALLSVGLIGLGVARRRKTGLAGA